MADRTNAASIRRWLEQTEQIEYGTTKDGHPKQLRGNRLGDFFILKNGELDTQTRNVHAAASYYNGL